MNPVTRKLEGGTIMPRGAWRLAGLGLLLALGCGDPPTYDHRGYTKSILETPGVFVHGAPRSEMDSLGTPILPQAEVIVLPDSAATGGG
jgi:hypothetical protein